MAGDFFGGIVLLPFVLIPGSVGMVGRRGGGQIVGHFSGRALLADLGLLAFIVRISPVCWIEEPLPGGEVVLSVVPRVGEEGGAACRLGKERDTGPVGVEA